MLLEGTKTCRLCGRVLWCEEEKEVCVFCKSDWHTIAQAWLEILPNNACNDAEITTQSPENPVQAVTAPPRSR